MPLSNGGRMTAGEGPGLLQGLLLPYETRALDRPELFRAGSLSWPDQGVVLRLQHDRNQPLTRFVPVVRTDGLHINVRLPDTGAARDASTLVRDGTLTGLSVEFKARREIRESGLRVILEAQLHGAGLVDDSSYPTAVAMRHTNPDRRRLWL